MAIYFLTPFVPLLISFAINKRKFTFYGKDITRQVFIAISFVIPFIIFGFRSPEIGTDTHFYCRTFASIDQYSIGDLLLQGKKREFEIGFLVFCRILSILGKQPNVLLLGSSLVINILYARLIVKQCKSVLLPLLVYFFLGNYLYNLSMMRQAIAVGIILNALPLIKERKYIKYVLLSLVASSFHSFAVVALLFLPITLLVKTRNQLKIVLAISAILIETTLDLVHAIVLTFFSHYDYYFRHNYNSEQVIGVTAAAYIIIEFIMLFFIIKNGNLNDDSRNYTVIYSLALVGAMFGLIMMPRFGIYERIAKFFQPFLIVAMPLAAERMRNKQLKTVILWTVITYSFFYYAYIIVTNPYKIVPFHLY